MSAVEAAVAVAAAHGIRCDEPVVLRDAWHVLVHLRPAPVVARVSNGRPYPDGPPEEDVIRELAVAGCAARAGAPVVPPADVLPPGPHRHGGHVVAFWRYVEARGELDPRAAGEGLRAVHEALAGAEDKLPELHTGDTLAQLDALPPSADVELLRELGARLPAGRWQAVHGDAHLENCLQTAAGPLWHDFETTCRGPRELDLAALVLGDRSRGGGTPEAREALAAYGDHDTALLEECLPVYAAWIYASWLVASSRRPELRGRLDERLRWLGSRYGS